MTHTFQEVETACAGRGPELLQEFIPAGRRQGKQFYPDPTDTSYSINIDTGKGHDFAGNYPNSSGFIGAVAVNCFNNNQKAAKDAVAGYLGLSDHRMTDAERQAIKDRAQAAAAKRAAEAEAKRQQGMKRAREVWKNARPASNADLPYLMAKDIKPYSAKVGTVSGRFRVPGKDKAEQRTFKNCLLIPAYRDGELIAVEAIHDGFKPLQDGSNKRIIGPIQGAYCPLGNWGSGLALMIAEGYATGASLHECTGHPVAVAFNANNLGPVTRALREKYPDAWLLVCADNDQLAKDGSPRTDDKNPGIEAAKAAIEGLNRAEWIAPPEGGDFNDMHQAHGAELVREVIAAGIARATKEGDKNLPCNAIDVASRASINLVSGVIMNENPSDIQTNNATDENIPQTPAGLAPPTYVTETIPDETDEDQGDDKPGVKVVGQFRIFERVTHEGKRYPNGVYFEKDSEYLRICSVLRVTGKTRDNDGDAWGRLLEFRDPEGKEKQWAMPCKMLSGTGQEYREELLNAGLEIEPGDDRRKALTSYIQTVYKIPFVRCVEKLGWFDGAYVFPDRTIGRTKERVIIQSESATYGKFHRAGTLDGWKKNISAQAPGNDLVIFGIAISLAAACNGIAGGDTFVIHFRGGSSQGKTTIGICAASAWGRGSEGDSQSYINTWRATDNALEGVAQAHNDALLVLDELKQCDPDKAKEVAYMLGNGQGKIRASNRGYGMPKKPKTWRLICLSTGEISLTQHLKSAGFDTHAGQEVRVLDIPIDGGRYGAFDKLHGHDNGAALAEALKKAAITHYGHAAPAFITAMIDNGLDTARSTLMESVEQFRRDVVQEGASGQVRRAAKHFGLIAAAGELATQYGITGWEPGTATTAAKAVFNRWLSARGGTGDAENRQILAQVAYFIEQHGTSRFTPFHCPSCEGTGKQITESRGNTPLSLDCIDCKGTGKSKDDKTINRAGFRKLVNGEYVYYVLPQSFEQDICQGYDKRRAIEVLKRAGWLIPGTTENIKAERLPGIGVKRCYVIKIGGGIQKNDVTDVTDVTASSDAGYSVTAKNNVDVTHVTNDVEDITSSKVVTAVTATDFCAVTPKAAPHKGVTSVTSVTAEKQCYAVKSDDAWGDSDARTPPITPPVQNHQDRGVIR